MGGLRLAGALAAVAVAIAAGGYALYTYARPYLHGSNCEVRTAQGTMPLDLEQASNASTIAGVAFRQRLPEQAVVIAYAAAMQESRIRNLAGGDRDSVGLFQQRPSQGWGSQDKLQDPVYAADRFFNALAKVKDFLEQPVHESAQQVQRSADGTAYARHAPKAKVLARAFTGRVPAAMRCWFPPNMRNRAQRAAAVQELRRAFGRLRVHADGDGSAVDVARRRSGWAISSWAVAHAQVYGLTTVRYAGKRWSAHDGHTGWTTDKRASADRVLIR